MSIFSYLGDVDEVKSQDKTDVNLTANALTLSELQQKKIVFWGRWVFGPVERGYILKSIGLGTILGCILWLKISIEHDSPSQSGIYCI
jgi:hypothetical protein